MKYLFFVFISLFNLNCNSHNKNLESKFMSNERFIRVDDNLAVGTSLILHREIKKSDSMIGDFLSRLWNLYGEPTEINFEGFGYTFKDSETGLIFTAYSAGSGPAYGGNYQDREKLIPIIKSFDKILDDTTLRDCEIEFETDFGLLKTGAKNGIPYDILIEE